MINKLSCVLISILVVGIFTQCQTQEKTKTANINANSSIESALPKKDKNEQISGGEIQAPDDQAQITAGTPVYELKKTDLEFLQTLPIPNLKFVFEDREIEINELSKGVKDVLNEHWREAIKFRYDEKFNKPKNIKEAYDRDMSWVSTIEKNKQKLQNLEINAPKGSRKISQTEALESFALLNKEAVNIIDKVKNVQ